MRRLASLRCASLLEVLAQRQPRLFSSAGAVAPFPLREDLHASRLASSAQTSCSLPALWPEAQGFPHMLLDKQGRRHTYLRISLTERCNLRCTYCMPAEGAELTPSGKLLTAAEIERIARLFVASGVTKIRLTGGEPTVRPDLEEIAARLGALPGLRDLAITSNGILLAKKLPALRAAGLTAVNISLDSLVASKFELLTRRLGHDRVLACIDAALAAGYSPVKVNVVVMRGVNEDELLDFAALTRHKDINVRFIEYMPFDGNAWTAKKMVSYAEMRARIAEAHPGMYRLDDAPEEVAKNFRLPDHRGSVSFISSMSSHFCGGCNRLRLMADGALKVCLFGANEVSLRDAVRSGADDAALADLVAAAVARKKAAHAGIAVADLVAQPNRPMVRIGG